LCGILQHLLGRFPTTIKSAKMGTAKGIFLKMQNDGLLSHHTTLKQR
jgi:hypothetical protein